MEESNDNDNNIQTTYHLMTTNLYQEQEQQQQQQQHKLPSMSQLHQIDDTHLDIEYLLNNATTTTNNTCEESHRRSNNNELNGVSVVSPPFNLLPVENESFVNVDDVVGNYNSSSGNDNNNHDFLATAIAVVDVTHYNNNNDSLQQQQQQQLQQHQQPIDQTAADQTKDENLDDADLLQLSVKDLNRRLQGMPKAQVVRVKQKRRTLKNRGYAQNCRQKKQVQRKGLEGSISGLEAEIRRLKADLEKMRKERDEARKLLCKSS